jgi:hypothetical protein
MSWIPAKPNVLAVRDLSLNSEIGINHRLHREFSSYASKEKGRFIGTAEQADSVEHHALEREVAGVDGL